MNATTRQRLLSSPGINLALFAGAMVSMTLAGAYLSHFDSDLRRFVALFRPEWLVTGLAFAISLMAILTAHEFGHYLAARHYGVKSTLPFFIPAPNLVGTFGAVIIMRSRIPNRKALFDIGAAGPIAGLIVAFFAAALGLMTARTEPFDPNQLSRILPQGAVFFGPNLLMLLIGPGLDRFLGDNLLTSPLLDAAFIGFMITFLNLLPAGQLDGGHIAYALLGERSKWLTVGSLAALTAAGISFGWWAWIFVAVFLLVFMAVTGFRHPPPEHPEEELGLPRILFGAVILYLFIMIFAPVPVEIYAPALEEVFSWLGSTLS